MERPNLPAYEVLQHQAAWLAPARSRLLRRVQVAHRRTVLDLACGFGAVTGELSRRSVGRVVAVDVDRTALTAAPWEFAGAHRVCGDAARLPFADESFDLVLSQFALLWLDAPRVVGEIRRILAPDGVLLALEPDYGGMIEHPPSIATREIWLSSLRRAGADPEIGRKLPGLLAAAGLRVRTDLPDRLKPPSPLRHRLLRGLPLAEGERELLRHIEAADAGLGDDKRVVHLPMFLITATKKL